MPARLTLAMLRRREDVRHPIRSRCAAPDRSPGLLAATYARTYQTTLSALPFRVELSRRGRRRCCLSWLRPSRSRSSPTPKVSGRGRAASDVARAHGLRTSQRRTCRRSLAIADRPRDRDQRQDLWDRIASRRPSNKTPVRKKSHGCHTVPHFLVRKEIHVRTIYRRQAVLSSRKCFDPGTDRGRAVGPLSRAIADTFVVATWANRAHVRHHLPLYLDQKPWVSDSIAIATDVIKTGSSACDLCGSVRHEGQSTQSCSIRTRVRSHEQARGAIRSSTSRPRRMTNVFSSPQHREN